MISFNDCTADLSVMLPRSPVTNEGTPFAVWFLMVIELTVVADTFMLAAAIVAPITMDNLVTLLFLYI